MKKIGIADTAFSRVDMASFALEVLKAKGKDVQVERYTVPGIKDLPLACKLLFERYGCDIVIALGMVGKMPIDTQCAHEASTGIQNVQLSLGKHILEVFVHENEGKDEADLLSIFKDRTQKHTEHALLLLQGKEAMQDRAGTGRRQGRQDRGPLSPEDAKKKRKKIAIVVSDMNKEITSKMLEAAKKAAEKYPLDVIIQHVPGAFELPFGCRSLIEKVDGIVTIAAILKGETGHDEVIGHSVATNLAQLSMQYNKPITLGVSGPKMTLEQAKARIARDAENATNACARLLLGEGHV